MRQTRFAIGLVSLAFAVSASALAQTSADTAGKKASRVLFRLRRRNRRPGSTPTAVGLGRSSKKGNARFVEKNMKSPGRLAG